MSLDKTPIRRTLMKMLLLACGVVVLVMSAGTITYELVTLRQSTARALGTVGEMIAANSTAALAFKNVDDAEEVLAALKADRHIVSAALYSADGGLFAQYRPAGSAQLAPATPGAMGDRFERGHMIDVQAVSQGEHTLGTLYIESDMDAAYERLRLSALIAVFVMAVSFLVAYAVSRRMQRRISDPIIALTEAARVVSTRGDYSVRATRASGLELSVLTETFNQMLTQIGEHHSALAESELRLRSVLNAALSAVVVMDASGRITDWNVRAEGMFGWPAREVLGRGLVETIAPPRTRATQWKGIACQVTGATNSVPEEIVELTALNRAGTEFPVELSVSPLRRDDTVTYCGFITDITSRKEAQDRIHAQLARLDLLRRITSATGERLDLPSIFKVVLSRLEDQLPVAFAALCLYDSHAARLTLTSIGPASLPAADAIGFKQQMLLPIDQNGLARCMLGELVYESDAADAPFSFPQRLARGGFRSLVLAPLLLEKEVFGVLIAGRTAAGSFDSTDCEFIRQLSEHVALATHQAQLYGALQQAYDDLRQSQHTVMQQERLRALGQMASGIAHDINNAISPVALYTESLLEREPNLSGRARGYLTTIQQAIEDVASTVARMREFYRPREPELLLSRVSLNRIVEQVSELTQARWRDQAQQRGVDIDFRAELVDALPDIMGAEGEIRDALINLVFNAVDALPTGGSLVLRTRLDPADAAGNPGRVFVEVSDNGIGMDEETRRRCIEPFYTTKGERGTGLGLAMVYGMVQRHSADFEIDSTPGAGTIVRLAFAEVDTTATIGVSAAATPESVPRLAVLIVDDDPLLIKSIRDILETDGHNVTAATGGQAGIDAFVVADDSDRPFDIVITDLGMPYVDGRKVSAAIKARSPDTPVILLTGWGKRLLADNDIPPHVDRVLSKPPRLAELRGALAELAAAQASAIL
jgi:PAS domain S-box-containing protein